MGPMFTEFIIKVRDLEHTGNMLVRYAAQDGSEIKAWKGGKENNNNNNNNGNNKNNF